MSDHSKDYDDTTRWPLEWWNTIGDDSPSPYATATWTYFQEVTELDETDD